MTFFIIGCVLGAILGFAVCALLVVGGDDDDGC